MNALIRTHNMALTACLALGFILAGSQALAQSAPPLQRLKVDPSGRFLIRDDGTPFFWLGDTAWFIMRLSNDEILHYLSNRVQKGFTGIQVDLNPYAWTNMVPPGEVDNPFIDDNPERPNESYWRRVDWMVDEAARRGLYVLLTPMWGQHYPRYVAADTEKAYHLGKWLGGRYRNRSHVMWFVSGEYDLINRRPITRAEKAIFNAVARGLEEGHGGSQLMTIHPSAPGTSSVDFHHEPWLDFNMLQSGHYEETAKWGRLETYMFITGDYNRTPTKPVFEGEPTYEDIIDGYFRTRDDSGTRMGEDVVRRKAYWSVFAGGFGHTYGHNDVQVFWSPGKPKEAANRIFWRDALVEAPGAGQMRHLRTLIESRSFLNRIPDQSVVASHAGEGKGHIRATRASDGAYAMVYIPTGRAVSVDMSKITGVRVRASWFDPRTGDYAAIGDYPNRGTQVFDPPGETAVGNDWVLVLDAKLASRNQQD